MTPILAIFSIALLLQVLLWGVWVLLNLWIWQKSKALGNLLMLIGAGIFCLSGLLLFFNSVALADSTVQLLALIALTAGFFLSVKPMVAAQIAALQAKAKSMTHKDGGPSTPPTTPAV